MKRRIDSQLLLWKDDPHRQVLLVRGARQVGKTFSIRALGKLFPHFFEINFEIHRVVHSFFEGNLEPKEINEKLSAYFGTPIIPGQTLLFFDEIQACPNAIRALRFYQENMPDLHVVAAGSLLEFALAQIPSFGVGRIASLFMYPLNFQEFLWAEGQEALDAMIDRARLDHPMDAVFHDKLLAYGRVYSLLGGLPAVVQIYVETRDLATCARRLDELLASFQDDFAKYASRAQITKLREVWMSTAYQAGEKFKYAKISEGSGQAGYKDALELLVQSGLVYKIHHSAARGVPLGAQIDPKKFKVIPFDIGLYQRMLGLSFSEQIVHSHVEWVHKGCLAEVLVGLELVACATAHLRSSLFYWHREARSSNAELDYVIAHNDRVVPVEVKAGATGRMKSLHLFMQERSLSLGVRISHENFNVCQQVQHCPIYAVRRLLKINN